MEPYFRVRCMITEHLSKVPLGALMNAELEILKRFLNEDIEKLELCLAHNILNWSDLQRVRL